MVYTQILFVTKFCSHWKYCNITRNIPDLVSKSICHFNMNPGKFSCSNSRPLLPKWRICRMALIKLHNIAIVGFVCDDIMNERSKILMQFHTSWLASLRTRYYFRLRFSFICSGYDFTLIKKSQTLNCYSFLQKFLLK